MSNLLKSQQDLQLLLEEGELEEQLKNTLEADLETINTAATAEAKNRGPHDFEVASKDTSHSGSIPGSEPLSRKEFVYGGLKDSPASSMQGSKASLSSSLHKGSKASVSSTTPPKGSKASLEPETAPKESQSTLLSETHSKESNGSLLSEAAPESTVNVESETLPSSLPSEPPPPKEESDSKEAAAADIKVSKAGSIMGISSEVTKMETA